MGSQPFPNIIPPKYTHTDNEDSSQTKLSQEFYNYVLPIFCPSPDMKSIEEGLELHGVFFLSSIILTMPLTNVMQIAFQPSTLSRKRQKNKPHTQICELPLQGGTRYLCNSAHCPRSHTWQNIETDMAKICKIHPWGLGL